jgi:histidinol dehydrogenase
VTTLRPPVLDGAAAIVVQLGRRSPAQLAGARRAAVDEATLDGARVIVDDVRARGMAAALAHGQRLGDIRPGDPALIEPAALKAAYDACTAEQQGVLTRTAERIRAFAAAQRAALGPATVGIAGGQAGHHLVPVERAGCYAPGGRFPLPSSVLMTAVTARVANVASVVVASPRPARITLAAAHVAGADALVALGGAQAVALLAYGSSGYGDAPPLGAVDVIVGPGNRWVTAAKRLVAGDVGIDMLAGPSELVVLADESADPAVVAADLIGQAEHDEDALAVLVTTHEPLVAAVEAELSRQLMILPTAATARASLAHGFAVVVDSIDEGLAVVNRLAPEHLELEVADAPSLVERVRHAGAIFVGTHAAEVLGDYGAGPNHVLPTGTTARHAGGLSVLTFLRMRTWLRIDDPAAAREMVDDAVALARLEGLEGHARSAARRQR